MVSGGVESVKDINVLIQMENCVRKIPGFGRKTARIVLLGEAPGQDEELRGQPFAGASGQELTRMLTDADIDRNACYVTNVVKYRPLNNDLSCWMTDKKRVGQANKWQEIEGRWCAPFLVKALEELHEELEELSPTVIIGFGNLPLWALTGEWGITNWRGSQLHYRNAVFIPTYHPAAVLRQWSWRNYVVHDLRFRVVPALQTVITPPKVEFFYTQDSPHILNYINNIPNNAWVAVDIETGSQQITCIGLCYKKYQALCIPMLYLNAPCWTNAEWKQIAEALQKLFNRCYIVGQNYNYDRQWLERKLDLISAVSFDTLIAQSVLYPGESRDLGTLASLYCSYYVYWKEGAANWFKAKSTTDYQNLFEYNCRDVSNTLEIALEQQKRLLARGLEKQFIERMAYNNNIYKMMERGLQRDTKALKILNNELEETKQELACYINEIVQHELNPKSAKQVNEYFYRELGCKPILVKRGKTANATESSGHDALGELIKKYPEHKEIAIAILDYRSLSSLQANFVEAKEDDDGRLRSNFTSVGTETFRITSNKNNFGRGCNMLNLTDGNTQSGRALPNCRNVIVPDSNYRYFNCDLDRADLQIVVWEADDTTLKQWLRRGVDIHIASAIELFGLPEAPIDELCETHPNYTEWKTRYSKQRQQAKRFVHLTNYGGSSRKAAQACGVLQHEADRTQRRWFAAHPGISKWHRRVTASLYATRSVRNIFGYVRSYFDRVETLLPEALAWIPQSTIALVTSKIHMNFDLLHGVEVQLQVYDSLAGQYLINKEETILQQMYAATQVVIPYPDKLVIPMGLAVGDSWGNCHDRSWPN